MFVTKSRFDRIVEYLEREIRDVRNENYNLKFKHYQLLNHLGLYEHTPAQTTVLLSKAGPEPSE